MVTRQHTAEAFLNAAVKAFLRTYARMDPEVLGKQLADEKVHQGDTVFARLFLTLDEVTTIAVENGWAVVGKGDDGVAILQRSDSSDEVIAATARGVVRKLAIRINTNLLSAGAGAEMLDVTYDDTDGFRFFITDEARKKHPSLSKSNSDSAENSSFTLKRFESFLCEADLDDE